MRLETQSILTHLAGSRKGGRESKLRDSQVIVQHFIEGKKKKLISTKLKLLGRKVP